MKASKLVLGMLTLALTFGLVLAGCDGDSDVKNTDPKELEITEVPATIADTKMADLLKSTNGAITIGLYPPGTSLTDVKSDVEEEKKGAVAAAGSPSKQSSISTVMAYDSDGVYSDKPGFNADSDKFGIKAWLYGNLNTGIPKVWTGTGTYDVYFIVKKNDTTTDYYCFKQVNFSSTTTTVQFDVKLKVN